MEEREGGGGGCGEGRNDATRTGKVDEYSFMSEPWGLE